MRRERSTEPHTLPHGKQSRAVAVGRRPLHQVLGANLGGGGVGKGRTVHEGGGTCIPMADSCWYIQKPTQHCKTALLQVKINTQFFKKTKSNDGTQCKGS